MVDLWIIDYNCDIALHGRQFRKLLVVVPRFFPLFLRCRTEGRDTEGEEWKEFLARFFAVMSAMLLTDWRIVLLPIKEIHSTFVISCKEEEGKKKSPNFPNAIEIIIIIITIENNLTTGLTYSLSVSNLRKLKKKSLNYK